MPSAGAAVLHMRTVQRAGCCLGPAQHPPHAAHRVASDHPRPSLSTEAVELYTKALQLSPLDAALLGNRSAALLAAGRVDEALSDAQVGGRLLVGFAVVVLTVAVCGGFERERVICC